MKKYSLFIIIIPLILLVSFGFLYLKNNEVERYGVVFRNSTSGNMRFSYYDIQQNKILDSWDSHPWFFAAIKDLENYKSVDDVYNYVKNNENSIFKITGTKEKDDCEYYDNGTCLENITIKEIKSIENTTLKITDTKKNIPYKFEDYPINNNLQGKQAPLNLKSHPRGLQFKTVISNAYKEGPNFAGHYTVAEWGCGTSCQNHAIVDNRSGNIIDAEIGSSYGVEYKLDSQLFVVNPRKVLIDNFGDDIPEYFKTGYYELSEDGLKMRKLEN